MGVAPIKWQEPAFEGDTRMLGFCGNACIGAVFVPGHRARYWRWRVWVTANMNPVEGAAKSCDMAREAVEDRFQRFLDLADLEPLRKAT